MNKSYTYTAKKGPLEIVRGNLAAVSLDEALKALTAEGLRPLEIRLSVNNRAAWRVEVTAADINVMTHQLANLTECDVPLVQSLRLIGRRVNKPAVLELVEDMITRIEEGAMLSQAVGAHPRYFSSSYVHMVKAGEMSGQLGAVLRKLEQLLEQEAELSSRIRLAMYYPLFVLAVGILTIMVMLTFVVPRMSGLFEEFHAALPIPTKILLGLSQGLQQHWPFLVFVLAVLGYVFSRWVGSSHGRRKLDVFLVRLPLYGDFVYQTEMTRVLRTLGMLLGHGVEMVAALSAAREVVGNAVFKDGLEKTLNDVKDGMNFSKALAGQAMFDELVVSLVNMGEESGDLSKGLQQAAVIYERDTCRATAVFLSLFGPALLVVIVGFTGFVAAALLLPVLQMDMAVK
jgi:type II secretory pathway component PulF